MSSTKQFAQNDPAAKVRQAGGVPKGNKDTSAMCMRPDLMDHNREGTPERLKKYRQS